VPLSPVFPSLFEPSRALGEPSIGAAMPGTNVANPINIQRQPQYPHPEAKEQAFGEFN
jgi:hypothetical protein